MTAQAFTVSEVSDQLGISPATVRRWCKEYSAHLSPGAHPDMGSSRVLSSRDLEVFREVSRLRSEKLSPTVINQRLRDMVFSAPIIESSQTAPASLQPTIVELVQITTETIESRMESRLQARLEERDRRLDALESQRLRVDAIWIAVAAFIAGLIVGLAAWWF